MNIPTILAIAVVVTAAVNALHRHGGRQDERFLYNPQSVWLRFIFAAWAVATVGAALLFLAGVIAGPTLLGVTLGLAIGHQLYSIARRQQHRAT